LRQRGTANHQRLSMDVRLDGGLVRLHLKLLRRKGLIELAGVKRGLDGGPRHYYRLTEDGLATLQDSEARL
jgi:predicted ArsR family transcriptional regulator